MSSRYGWWLGAIFFLGCAAWGGPPQYAEIPADTGWIVHADVAGLLASASGTYVRDLLRTRGVEARLNALAALSTVHVLRDIRDVTLCGPDGDPRNAILYVRGRFDAERLSLLVREMKQTEDLAVGGRTVLRWKAPGHPLRTPSGMVEKSVYACFPSEGVLLMTGTLEAMTRALATLEGTAPNAMAAGTFADVAAAGEGFLLLAAKGLRRMEHLHPRAMVVRLLNEACLTVDESGGATRLRLALKAETPAVAENLKQMAEGALAYGRLALQDNDVLLPLLAGAGLQVERDVVRFTVEVSTDDLPAVTEAWREARQALHRSYQAQRAAERDIRKAGDAIGKYAKEAVETQETE